MSSIKETPHISLPSKSKRHKMFGSVKPGPRTKPEDKSDMADLQNTVQDFLFEIDAVGISNVKHPVTVQSTLNPASQTTVGTFKLTSNIDQMSKGTNMSRFLEVINEYSKKGFIANFDTLKCFAKDLRERLKQNKVDIELSFPWFYERKGPRSNISGLNNAEATMLLSYSPETNFKLSASLIVFVTTLCPCSKEISEYSAHSQRGKIQIDITFTNDFDDETTDWKKSLLEAAESNASSPIHPVLKRPDEKEVTEKAYENPRFVEDIVRLVAADLYELPFVKKFSITCQNEESIHLHDAIATISFNKETD